MEQHAIPRQITTFEFKLIGFLTLKQFLYLVVFAGMAVLTYFLTPIPLLNWFGGFVVFGMGGIFVFFKYNERSLDIWIKNLITRLISPSQYVFKKRNAAPHYLDDVFISVDSATISTHMDARQKLSSYISSQNPPPQANDKQKINELLYTTHQPNPTVREISTAPIAPEQESQPTTTNSKHPSLVGVIKNRKELPLPNIMVHIKDRSGRVVRILKTNNKGVFATFHPLPEGNYDIEVKDLAGGHFFDGMELSTPYNTSVPLSIYSKETL